MKIDIEQYLSEEDKKRIAEEEWKKLVHKGLVARFKDNHTERVENYERVISNAVHRYLDKEVDSIIGVNHKKMIEDKVKKTLLNKKDLSYNIFKRRDAWESEDGEGLKILKKSVQNNEELIVKKVEETLNKINYEDIREDVEEIIYKVITNKLTGT